MHFVRIGDGLNGFVRMPKNSRTASIAVACAGVKTVELGTGDGANSILSSQGVIYD